MASDNVGTLELSRFPMLHLYYHPSPNPLKVALCLEEAGLPYGVIPVDTRRGEQHLSRHQPQRQDAGAGGWCGKDRRWKTGVMDVGSSPA